MTVGSHLIVESYLPDMIPQQQKEALVGSKKILEDRLGKPAYYLAYPIGGFSEEVKKIVREAGYRLAFTTNRGYDRFNRDMFELKRIRIKDGDSDPVMWLKLSGCYNLIRLPKRPY
jgi:peptidoglycan/xylan/chitin deacetylase (PgdA/CDA1 family)